MSEETLRAVERVVEQTLNQEVPNIRFGPVFARADRDPDGTEFLWVYAIHDSPVGYVGGDAILDVYPPLTEALRDELGVTAFPVMSYVHESEEPEWKPEVLWPPPDR